MGFKDFRKELAEKFASVLEAEGLAWKKQWVETRQNGAPRNALKGKYYRGINAFNLALTAMEKRYKDPRWCTYKQALELNKGVSHVGEGEHGTKIEYWTPYDIVDKKIITWGERDNLMRSGERVAQDFDYRCKIWHVYNGEQIVGIPELDLKEPELPSTGLSLDEAVLQISNGMGVEILHDGGNSAFYRPSEDKIHLPVANAFYSEADLNSVALHELTHASGHESRLARKQKNGFGSEDYAYEELVAEIGSAFLSAELGVEMTDADLENHQAYVAGWAKEIREKPEALVSAITDANAAADYMEEVGGFISEKEREERKSKAQEVDSDAVYDEENQSKTNNRSKSYSKSKTPRKHSRDAR